MKKVILETPYRGKYIWNRWANIRYARKCARDCLYRGEAPFASHLLYTQMLNDNDIYQRDLGIRAGFAWGKDAEATVVYVDRGISPGMALGISEAQKKGRHVEYRQLVEAGKKHVDILPDETKLPAL